MNKGKVTCEKLKAIRREVAEKLGIEYTPRECTFEGDCPGTCPLCQQETDLLMEQVNIRLQDNPELVEDIQSKVFDMLCMKIESERSDKDEKLDDYIEMGIYPQQGLIDITEEEDVSENEPLEDMVEEPLMGDIPVMGGIPFKMRDYTKIEELCNYYKPNIYKNCDYHEETDLDCFYSIESRIYFNHKEWDSIFSADDPKLAFQEMFVKYLCMFYPHKLTHLLQVFFADHPTYKKQLMAIVMSIKKGQR